MVKTTKRRSIEKGIWKTESGTYMVRYYDHQGRERAVTKSRLQEARDFKAKVRIDKSRGEYIDPRATKTKFSELAAMFLEQKLGLRRRTRDKYLDTLRVHLIPAFGDSSVGQITPGEVQAWIVNFVRREHHPGRTYSSETIRGSYSLFAAMMKFAVARELIPKSPCRGIELPAIQKQERRYLTEEEVERLVASIEARYKALTYTAAYLGLRWQEVAGLRPQSLDMRPGRLATLRVLSTIERSNGVFRPVEIGKSKASRRTLKIPEFLREAIAWHMGEFKSDEWVFPAPEGSFLRDDNFRPRIWRPAVEKAGLAPLTFHELRHTAAAFMIDEGVDPLQVKRRMGHEDIRTTFDIYGHLFPDREEQLVAALDRRQRSAASSHADFLRTIGEGVVVGLNRQRVPDQVS